MGRKIAHLLTIKEKINRMKFIVSNTRVSLTESKKPCQEAKETDLTPLDIRDVKSLDEAKGKIWYKDWIKEGENHREENGMVVSDKKAKVKQWIVDLNTLDELLAFQGKYGDILVSDSSPYKEAKHEIIIQRTEEK
jgi:hypothetical protein